MSDQQLCYDAPVALVGGGEVNWKALDDHPIDTVIALDGGANALVDRGITPDYIMGDFDSIAPELRDGFDPKRLITLDDQDFTDFRKALDRIEAPVIYAHGVLGGRMDHALDALSQISDLSARRIYLMGQYETAFVWPSGGGIDLDAGIRISFWSAGEAQIVASHGLRWSLDGITIGAAAMSVSNETTGAVTITYAGDPLICLIEAGVRV